VDQEDITEEEFRQAFRSYFGVEWTELLDTAYNSYDYIAYNDIYFAIRDLQPVESTSLEQFLRDKEFKQSLNIVIS